MTQVYTDPRREPLPHALPNAETFYLDGIDYCPECGLAVRHDGLRAHGSNYVCLCGFTWGGDDPTGWYWQACFPGCLPDGEPEGPFKTEAEAIADAQADDFGDDIEDEDEDDLDD